MLALLEKQECPVKELQTKPKPKYTAEVGVPEATAMTRKD